MLLGNGIAVRKSLAHQKRLCYNCSCKDHGVRDCTFAQASPDAGHAVESTIRFYTQSTLRRGVLQPGHRGGHGTFLKYRRYRYSVLENQKYRGTFGKYCTIFG